jgi:hypothetical protein
MEVFHDKEEKLQMIQSGVQAQSYQTGPAV